MLNLGEYDLIPFKTKARTRSGVVVIYVGQADVSTYHSRWLATDNISGFATRFTTYYSTFDGRYNQLHGAECPADLVAIAKPRQLAVGDVIRITGPIIAIEVETGQDSGNDMDYVDYVSEREFVITRIGQRQDRTVYKFVSDHCEDFGDLLWEVERPFCTFVRRSE